MKRCKICGALFNPKHNNQIYCSKNCARLGKNELQKNWVKKNIPKKEIKKVCTVCGAEFLLSSSAQTMCSKECVNKKKALRANLYYQNNKTTLLKKRAEYREKQGKKCGKQCILCGAATRGFVCNGSECRKIYHQIYSWTQQRAKNNIRASGKKYVNSPEKLQSIKEKYKKGVSFEHIKSMLE